ncbi:MAG: hypothetical protein JSS09_01850 [Verrucomicrobia bacterium]|nr:hypothetical protein [Verrucomicrobiota bacterium]
MEAQNKEIRALIEQKKFDLERIGKTKAAITEDKFQELSLEEQNKEIRALIEQEELKRSHSRIIEKTKTKVGEAKFKGLSLEEQNKEIQALIEQEELQKRYPGIIERTKTEVGGPKFNGLSLEKQNKKILNFIKKHPDLAANLELEGRHPGIINETTTAITKDMFNRLSLEEQNKEIKTFIGLKELEYTYPGIIAQTKKKHEEANLPTALNAIIKPITERWEKLNIENPEIITLYTELCGEKETFERLSWFDRLENCEVLKEELDRLPLEQKFELEIGDSHYNLIKTEGGTGYKIEEDKIDGNSSSSS